MKVQLILKTVSISSAAMIAALAAPVRADATPECNVDGVAVDSTECGVGSDVTGAHSTAVGDDATATADNTTAVGQNADAAGLNATAIGRNVNAIADQSTVVGTNSVAVTGAIGAAAIGRGSGVTSALPQATAIGNQAYVNGASGGGSISLLALDAQIIGTTVGGSSRVSGKARPLAHLRWLASEATLCC